MIPFHPSRGYRRLRDIRIQRPLTGEATVPANWLAKLIVYHPHIGRSLRIHKVAILRNSRQVEIQRSPATAGHRVAVEDEAVLLRSNTGHHRMLGNRRL